MEKRLKKIQTFEQHSSELNISDVIARFDFDDDTESKIIRYLELRGFIKNSKSYNFTKKQWGDLWKEMEILKEWLNKIGNEL